RAGIETRLRQPLLDLLARRALLAMRQRHGVGGARARAAEGEELAVACLPQRLLHHLNVGGTDAADDRHETVSDPGLLGRGLDLRCLRLTRLLEIGAVVDQHGDALCRQPGDLLGSNLAAHQGALVELADHGQRPRSPFFGGDVDVAGGNGGAAAAGGGGAAPSSPPDKPKYWRYGLMLGSWPAKARYISA